MRQDGLFGLAGGPLLEGLHASTRQYLLQLLMYKSVFMGETFRAFAEQEPLEVREALVRIHSESIAEAAAMALAMRAWDAHPAGLDGILEAAETARRQFLRDLLELKNGIVDTGLAAAMRAPNAELRDRFMLLADIDRRHADILRKLLEAPTIPEHAARAADAWVGPTLGASGQRPAGGSFGGELRRAIEGIEQGGATVLALTLSAEGMRHARDEGVIDARTGLAFGRPVEVDMGWRGECFALQTSERIAYSELITQQRAGHRPNIAKAGEGFDSAP